MGRTRGKGERELGVRTVRIEIVEVLYADNALGGENGAANFICAA